MEQSNIAPSTPKDATKATAQQQELQEKLDHQGDDPQAPAGHQTYRDIPDET